MFGAHRGQHGAFPPPPCGKVTHGRMKKAESALDRPLALCRGSGAALANLAPAKPLIASTYQPENSEPDYAPGQRPVRMRERPDRPKPSRKALRPRRSQTTPPRPRELHPVGALARTHWNKMQPRKAGPLAKKCDKASKRVLTLPLRLGGYCRGL
jgi:hypothetical protein